MNDEKATRVAADRLHSAAIHLRRVRKADDASGVSPARLSALSVIVYAGPMTLRELAAAEQVTAPTMSRIVAGLERDRLVRRTADPRDGRAILLRATAKGGRILQRARERRIDRLENQLEELSERDVATLRRAAEILERLFGR